MKNRLLLISLFVITIIVPNSIARLKEGAQGEGGRGGRSNIGRPNRNSDARHGRLYRSISARGIGCEEQDRTPHRRGVGFHSTLHRKGRWGQGLVLSYHDRMER